MNDVASIAERAGVTATEVRAVIRRARHEAGVRAGEAYDRLDREMAVGRKRLPCEAGSDLDRRRAGWREKAARRAERRRIEAALPPAGTQLSLIDN